MTTNGIFLNGQPLDLQDSIDFQVIHESFQFHYMYHPPLARNHQRRALRRSTVRHLSALELAQMQEIQQAKGGALRK